MSEQTPMWSTRGFWKKTPKFGHCVPQNVFHKVSCKMCSMKYVPQNVFCEVCSVKCVLRNVFHEVCSAKCVLWSVFHKMCSVKCVLQSVFCEMCSMKCSLKCSVKCVTKIVWIFGTIFFKSSSNINALYMGKKWWLLHLVSFGDKVLYR